MKFRALTVVLSIVLFAFAAPVEQGVSFYTGSYDSLLREARKEQMPIILDFWASWCGPCKKMDQQTFTDPKLAEFINGNFLIYKVDIDSFDGISIKDKFAIEYFPSIVVLDSKAKTLEVLKGFYPPEYLEEEFNKIIQKHKIPISEESKTFAFNK